MRLGVMEDAAIERSDQETREGYQPLSYSAEDSRRQVVSKVERCKVGQSEGRADTGTGGNDGEARTLEQPVVAFESEILEMVGIGVERLEKRRRGKNLTARSENAEHLANGPFGVLEMLENRLAMDRIHSLIRIGQSIGITHHVDVRKTIDVQVDEIGMDPSRPTTHGQAESIGSLLRDDGFEGSGSCRIAEVALQSDQSIYRGQQPAGRCSSLIFIEHRSVLLLVVSMPLLRACEENRHPFKKRVAQSAIPSADRITFEQLEGLMRLGTHQPLLHDLFGNAQHGVVKPR